MQFSLIALLGLSAIAAAAPAADPAALAEASPNPEASVEIFARGSSAACCPKGKKSKCSPCGSKDKCPSDKPDKYSDCSNIGQLGLVNLLLCDILNNNKVSIPITIDLLNGL